MCNKVLEETGEFRLISSILDNVRDKIFQIGRKNKTIGIEIQLRTAILEFLHKEESRFSEDLRISAESLMGLQQVVQALECELNELQLKLESSINSTPLSIYN